MVSMQLMTINKVIIFFVFNFEKYLLLYGYIYITFRSQMIKLQKPKKNFKVLIVRKYHWH